MAKNRSEYLSLGLVQSKLKAAEKNSQPFFLYAHTEGAHTPYYPPEHSLGEFAEDLDLPGREARERVYEIHQNLYREIAHGLEYDDETWNSLEVMYDTLIHYIDSQIGAVFDTLQDLNIGETIFVVTSDHGDLLGEQCLLSHKVALHDGLLNVPLVIHGRDFEADSTDLLQHSDVMKTIMDWCGVKNDFMEGVNLDRRGREFVLSQRGDDYFWKTMDQVLEHNPNFDVSRFHEGLASTLRTANHKLVRSPEKTELFELPDESVSIADQQPQLTEELSEKLDEQVNEFGIVEGDGDGAEFTAEMKERLEDLGYV